MKRYLIFKTLRERLFGVSAFPASFFLDASTIRDWIWIGAYILTLVIGNLALLFEYLS